MKLTKKLVSAILVVAMTMSLIAPAMAANEEHTPEIVEANEIVLTQSNDTIVLKAVDFENGDACFYLLKNGVIIYEAYVDRDAMAVVSSDYEIGSTTTTDYSSYVAAIPALCDDLTIETNRTAGTITYEYYEQGYVMGTRSVTLKYGEDTDSLKSYYPKGPFANIADLAAALSTVFSLAGGLAGDTAAWILSIVGLATDSVDFVLSGPVKATCHIMAWTGTGYGEQGKIELQGNKYTFQYNNKTHYEYECNYYALSNYSSHNLTFANLFYTRIWGNGDFKAIRWS